MSFSFRGVTNKNYSKYIFAVRLINCIINFFLAFFYYYVLVGRNNLYVTAVIIPYMFIFSEAFDGYKKIDRAIQNDKVVLRKEIIKNLSITLGIFAIFVLKFLY